MAETTFDPKRRRSGGTRAKHQAASQHSIAQMPWRIPRNIDQPTEPLLPEGVLAIHKNALRILSDLGLEMLHPEARQILVQAGCRQECETIFFDPDFVTEMVARAPHSFTVTPRNPARKLTIGEGHILFGNVSSPPNAWDMARGKRA
ncbi:MAG: methyltransferase, partial [Rhodobacteraceae bacterium]|nr:methyltransferase [Paracoccaceae bacterium]